MYAHSNEIEEVAVVNLSGVNLEVNSEMEMLLGVRANGFPRRSPFFAHSF